jgi:hypothetical protein
MCSRKLQTGVALVATALLLAGSAVPVHGSSAEPHPEALGFRFFYPDKLSPKAFLQNHPCISGTWRFKNETDTHWVGALSYPTGNVAPPYPTGSEPAFLVQPIKVEKQKGLPVNLKTWQGAVILQQADPAVRFGTPKSLASGFKLVAIETAPGKATGFLFQKHKELKFSPSAE